MLARVVHKVGVDVTCAGLAGEVCDSRIGLSYCQKTCGFCAPYSYRRLKPYVKPQVSLLPVVMYQTRFEKDDCRGFALGYEAQPFNSLLHSMPALDGVRLGRVLTCINRRKHQETEFAFELMCPPGTVNPKCVNGKIQRTSRFEFQNQGIYAEMLPSPKHDIKALKTMNWLDLQSDEVVVSTMIYTEGAEVFTTLSVHFRINRAGEVLGTFKLMSYKDLIHDDKVFFVACMATTCVLFVVAAAMTLVQVGHDLRLQHGLCKDKAYEITCGLALAVYCIILLVSWSFQVPMSVEFLKTLHSFLDLGGTDTEHRNEAMQSFFDTKESVLKELLWSFRQRITAYVFLCTQFVQLVFHFNAHPKMAMLTSTIRGAMSNTLHFAILFSITYVMLAFMGFWMLGERLRGFRTMESAMITQLQMLIGEFIRADGSEYLNGELNIMYLRSVQAYFFTFSLVNYCLRKKFKLCLGLL
ncbi:unnamed protein product [Polarella glacialis]|uniref:Polycystin cation channel PKD1/PKD2 domain-containing protein n=1 Tax=Polarella glacialis TaxID=89957 RepID=A0A813FJG5_POLGL|nr:unnamed protein product [Polarella glacialis]